MEWIFNSLLSCILDKVGQLLAYLSSFSLSLFSIPMVQNALVLCQWVGMLLYTVGVLFAIFNYMIASKENEMVDLGGLILNIVYGLVATVMIMPGSIFIFHLSIIFQNLFDTLIDQVNSVSLVHADKINSIFGALKDVFISSLDGFWALVIFAVLIIAILIVLFQCLKRSGVFLVQMIIGYLYVFSIPSGGSDGFIEWCRQTIAIAVTNAIQVGLLMMGMDLLADFSSDSAHTMEKAFLGIGVILATTSVEKIAGRFGFAVNSRQHIGGAISQANSSVSLGRSVGSIFKGGN